MKERPVYRARWSWVRGKISEEFDSSPYYEEIVSLGKLYIDEPITLPYIDIYRQMALPEVESIFMML